MERGRICRRGESKKSIISLEFVDQLSKNKTCLKAMSVYVLTVVWGFFVTVMVLEKKRGEFSLKSILVKTLTKKNLRELSTTEEATIGVDAYLMKMYACLHRNMFEKSRLQKIKALKRSFSLALR